MHTIIAVKVAARGIAMLIANNTFKITAYFITMRKPYRLSAYRAHALVKLYLHLL